MWAHGALSTEPPSFTHGAFCVSGGESESGASVVGSWSGLVRDAWGTRNTKNCG